MKCLQRFLLPLALLLVSGCASTGSNEASDSIDLADLKLRSARVGVAEAVRIYQADCEKTKNPPACEAFATYSQTSPFDASKTLGAPQKWWWIDALKIKEAQSLILQPRPQLVAVVDSGLAPKMTFIPTRYKIGRNFTENPVNADNHGHGSAISMLIAGEPLSSGRPTGISKTSVALMVKVRDFGIPENPDQIEMGIRYAVDQGARVINLSLGDARPFFKTSIQYAIEKGVVVVASAGHGKASVLFPAQDSNVLSVSATLKDGKKSPKSSRGPKIDVCAPDANIGSTSFSTAIVSGLAALILEANPTLSGSRVIEIIKSTAENNGLPDCGAGEINPVAAVKKALALKNSN